MCPQDEDSEAVLAADFEIGHFIRERIVPRAVLYFTGEAIEDDDDDVSDQNAGTFYGGTTGGFARRTSAAIWLRHLTIQTVGLIGTSQMYCILVVKGHFDQIIC